MKQEDLIQGAILLDPVGERHEVLSIDTTTGADHTGWKYQLKVGKRKMKPLSFAAIETFFTLEQPEPKKPRSKKKVK